MIMGMAHSTGDAMKANLTNVLLALLAKYAVMPYEELSGLDVSVTESSTDDARRAGEDFWQARLERLEREGDSRGEYVLLSLNVDDGTRSGNSSLAHQAQLKIYAEGAREISVRTWLG